MRLFRKTIELSEKEMSEFIQAAADQPRGKTVKGYWDELAAGNGKAAAEDQYDDDDAEAAYSLSQNPLPANPTRAEVRNFLNERCELIGETTGQIEAVRMEYQEVTAYLQDTQLIDRAPEEAKDILADAARHILALEKELGKQKRKRNSLTDFQYQIMERYEDILPKEILRLSEEENYRAMIKSDLQKLEGEKGSLTYEQEEIENRRKFLIRMGKISGLAVLVLFLVYGTLFFSLEAAVEIPFLVTAGCAAVLAAYLFLAARQNTYDRKLNDKKRSRLVTLQNRVKIKYVNSTASLDYSYDKYCVNNSRELKYRFEQYVEDRDERARREQGLEAQYYYEGQIQDVLTELGLHDSGIWCHQADALLDRREMVEIRHRLNSRRQKLRERLEYNSNLRDTAKEELLRFRENNPEERSRMQVVLDAHEIAL